MVYVINYSKIFCVFKFVIDIHTKTKTYALAGYHRALFIAVSSVVALFLGTEVGYSP